MKLLEDYPRPSLAVDPVLLGIRGKSLMSLLWRRSNDPQCGKWALPGVFVNPNETFEAAVRRALRTKANIRWEGSIRQLFAWNKTERDPRGWVVTVAHYCLLPIGDLQDASSSDPDVGLFELSVPSAGTGPTVLADGSGRRASLAFDHGEILGLVVETLRNQLWTTDLALDALPNLFTLREMQTIYEAILGSGLNKDSFRRRVTKTQPLVMGTGQYQEQVDHRPAELYRRATAKDIALAG